MLLSLSKENDKFCQYCKQSLQKSGCNNLPSRTLALIVLLLGTILLKLSPLNFWLSLLAWLSIISIILKVESSRRVITCINKDCAGHLDECQDK